MRILDLELEVYQGPFDLLLSLVLKEEIDIFELPLIDVILAYLQEMEDAGKEDYWEEMTEFLLLMSLLVEIKSRLLLPEIIITTESEFTPEEAQEQLLARLFRYSKFKTAAEQLRDLGEDNYGAVLRLPSAQAKRRLPPMEEIAASGDVAALQGALMHLLATKQEPDTSHVAQVKVELQRQIRLIRRALAEQGRFSFESIFGKEEPLVQAVSLFALLDLLSRGEIKVSQSKIFGDIVVSSVKGQEQPLAQKSA